MVLVFQLDPPDHQDKYKAKVFNFNMLLDNIMYTKKSKQCMKKKKSLLLAVS